MKKLIVTFCMAGFIAFLTSCKTSGGATGAGAPIDGEWVVTEIDGQAVSLTEDGQEAFIGFDTKEKRVNGFAGCNRMFGGIDINTKKKTVSFANMASTKMMCPDMKTEDSLLSAMGQVSNYSVDGAGMLELKNGSGKTLVKLKKKN